MHFPLGLRIYGWSVVFVSFPVEVFWRGYLTRLIILCTDAYIVYYESSNKIYLWEPEPIRIFSNKSNFDESSRKVVSVESN
jgi:hypothetical protein